MRPFVICLMLLALVLPSSAATNTREAGAEPTEYFDRIDLTDKAPRALGIRVVPPLNEGPAQRAGLQVADFIVGVNGRRIRGRREYSYARACYECLDALTLTVVRDGKLRNIVVADPNPGGYTKFSLTNEAPDPVKLLESWKISISDITGINPTASEKEPTEPTIFSRALGAFPSRACEEIEGLIKKGDPADRQWLHAVMRVFYYLSYEKYDEAAKFIAARKLRERKVAPFLDRLLEFYEALTQFPITEDHLPLDDYRVTAEFFAFCYPYPLLPEREVSDAFASDAEFQQLYNKAASRKPEYRAELVRKAGEYASRGGSDADTYINLTKSTMLDESERGGDCIMADTPLMQDGGKRGQLVRDLVDRLEQEPENKVEIALTLLLPAVSMHDENALGKAYDVISQAGAREMLFANSLLYNHTCFHAGLTEITRRAVTRAEAQLPLPTFYRYLSRRLPAIEGRVSGGYYFRRFHLHYNEIAACCDYALSSFVIRWPMATVTALTQSNTEELVALAGSALASDDPALANRALRVLTRDFYYRPERDRLVLLMDLRKKVGAGKMTEALSRVFFYNIGLGNDLPHFNKLQMWDMARDFLDSVEQQYYSDIAAELKTISNDDPTLLKKAETFYRKAGVPAVCALLATKLKAAGHNDAANMYANRGWMFYTVLVNDFRAEHEERQRVAVRAIRELGSVSPEAAEKARWYRHVEPEPVEQDRTRNREPEKKPEPEKEMVSLSAPGEFWFELKNGTILSGKPSFTSLVVKVSFGNVGLAVDQIDTVQFSGNGSSAKVQLRNGDKLDGEVGLAEFTVNAQGQDFPIKASQVRRMRRP
jgi:hypothetical protein